MFTQPGDRAVRLAIVLAGVLTLAGVMAPGVRAGEKRGGPSSLKLVPANAAFYSSMLRNREQLDLIRNSRAWARLLDLPAVKLGLQMAKGQWDGERGNLAPVKAWLDQKENRELVEMLGDAVSNEIFCYGSEHATDFVGLALVVANQARYSNALQQISGEKDDSYPEWLTPARAALRTLAQNQAALRMPDLVLGFKVSNPRRAEAQLKRLADLVEVLAGSFPPVKERFQYARVNGGQFLFLKLDGSLVPWDQVPVKKIESKEGEFDALVQKLKAMKFTISLGVRGDYLLLGMGEAADGLASLGGKGPGLETLPEFKPLAGFVDQRLTSIAYVSKAFRSRVSRDSNDLDSLEELGRQLLKKAGLPEEKSKALEKDLADFKKSMSAAQAGVGATLLWSFLTDRGTESYQYEYDSQSTLDGSRPLTLLNHVGGNPILAAVGRVKDDPQGYANFSKGIQALYPQLDEIVRSKLEGDRKEKYEKFMKAALPLIKRLDQATAQLLVPALADGQVGFVLDAKWTSKHWFSQMPATDKAMPMPELALVLGVSDADKLQKALAEYREAMNGLIAALREVAADKDVPEFQIPEPMLAKGPGGSYYSYPLPSEAGLDPQVVPTGGLSAQVAVLALSRAHAERLLASRPFKADGTLLADPKRPLMAAGFFNWPALVDAATPWVEFGVGKTSPLDGQQLDGILAQVRTVLEVLKVYRGSVSITYPEGGAVVTHGESLYRDLGGK